MHTALRMMTKGFFSCSNERWYKLQSLTSCISIHDLCCVYCSHYVCYSSLGCLRFCRSDEKGSHESIWMLRRSQRHNDEKTTSERLLCLSYAWLLLWKADICKNFKRSCSHMILSKSSDTLLYTLRDDEKSNHDGRMSAPQKTSLPGAFTRGLQRCIGFFWSQFSFFIVSHITWGMPTDVFLQPVPFISSLPMPCVSSPFLFSLFSLFQEWLDFQNTTARRECADVIPFRRFSVISRFFWPQSPLTDALCLLLATIHTNYFLSIVMRRSRHSSTLDHRRYAHSLAPSSLVWNDDIHIQTRFRMSALWDHFNLNGLLQFRVLWPQDFPTWLATSAWL